MADNFNMKQFLMENKLGAYSKLKNEGEGDLDLKTTMNSTFRKIDGQCYRISEKGEKTKVSHTYCHELAKEDYGKDLEDTEAAKQMDFLAEKDKTEEALSMQAADRMNGLVSQTALKALVNGTQTIIRDLKQDGFESDEIFEYIVSIIKDLE